MPSLNIVSKPYKKGESLPEVGRYGTSEIEKLLAWIYPKRDLADWTWQYRLAPSIVARSEAELFGFSMPRFALRVYLDEDRRAFVNARRIHRLCSLARTWSKRGKEGGPKVRRNWLAPPPASYLRACTCVGDSLLPIPDSQKEDHVLTAELGRVYGEVCANEKDISRVPYVKHMCLAGGLCSQATCFMASVLQHKYARGVYGLAEVTALAGEEESAELRLTGLNMPQMARYFPHERVGLNAVWQFPYDTYDKYKKEAAKKGLAPFLEQSLRTFIRSDMPVVLPMDSGRMAGLGSPALPGPEPGRSITETNGLGRLLPEKRPQMRRHVVLVIGCGDGDRFIFNDTARKPFMEADTAQLLEARQYENETFQTPRRPTYLPVTPGEVRMPLHDWHKGDFWPPRPGLISVAHQLQAARTEEKAFRCANTDDPQQWRLTTTEKVGSCGIIDRAYRKAVAGLVAGLTPKAEPGHWWWIQVGPKLAESPNSPVVWVWDAQQPPPKDYNKLWSHTVWKRCLCGVFRYDGTSWCPMWQEPPAEQPEEPPAPERKRKPQIPLEERLQGSVISSFSVRKGIGGAFGAWPVDHLACELYAFMQADVSAPTPTGGEDGGAKDDLCLDWRVWAFDWLGLRPFHPYSRYRWTGASTYRTRRFPHTHRALDRMSMLWNDDRAQGQWADDMSEHCEEHGIQIVGFATFLPELVGEDLQAGKADRALRFLVQLAEHFRGRGHPINTIEIVSGSLVRGLWPAIEKECTGLRKHLFVANRIQDINGALGNLLKMLKPMATEAAKCYPPLRIAIELEPGPLYVLQNLGGIKPLCDMLRKASDDGDALGRVVGLNLDIAHWILAGIKCEEVLGLREVRHRIVHAHISSHGHGHFGDLCLGEQKDAQDLLDWLHLTQDIARDHREKGWPPYSQHVSLELEAVRDRRVLNLAAGRLRFLLGLVAKGETAFKEWPRGLRRL